MKEELTQKKEETRRKLDWVRRLDDAKEETANGDRMFQEGNVSCFLPLGRADLTSVAVCSCNPVL